MEHFIRSDTGCQSNCDYSRTPPRSGTWPKCWW